MLGAVLSSSFVLFHLLGIVTLDLASNPDSYIGFLIAQLVKKLPAMQETLVQFLGQKDLLEKG